MLLRYIFDNVKALKKFCCFFAALTQKRIYFCCPIMFLHIIFITSKHNKLCMKRVVKFLCVVLCCCFAFCGGGDGKVVLAKECSVLGLPGGSLVGEVAEELRYGKKRVYIGGEFVGLSVKLDGVMVAEVGKVDTDAGMASVKNIYRGDVIIAIEGKNVRSAAEIIEAINIKSKKEYLFELWRGGEKKNVAITPLIDRVSGENRLGISVQGELSGLGTVSFVMQNSKFAALGHPMGNMINPIAIESGTVYVCSLSGIVKGERGKAGFVRGALNKNNVLGEVEKNTKFGVYGSFDEPKGAMYDIAKRDEVKCGNMKICSEISGRKELYSGEILRTERQNENGERGMAIRVTDKRLLELTGGIVQGMSGSPIVQNNKIVGAVTHVMINDPKAGYGMYAENMLNELGERLD